MRPCYYLILSMLLALGVAACSAGAEQTPQPTPGSGFVEITLLRHSYFPEKSSYEIGEHFFYVLRIENETQVPIKRDLISCNELFAFDSSSIWLHLIAPDEQDLLLPYQQDDIECTPNYIDPQDAWEYTIKISRWLHLRQIGRYVLRVEMEHLSQHYHSNEITFEIVEVPATLSPELVALTIQPERTSYTLTYFQNVQLGVWVTFTNRSGQVLTFLKPQDGSYARGINPGYDFTVLDSTGRSLIRNQHVFFSMPVYNDETQFMLEPGDSYRMLLPLGDFPEMAKPGEYRVRLTYIVHENALDERGLFLLDEPMNWEEDVFTGVLESNEITITITE